MQLDQVAQGDGESLCVLAVSGALDGTETDALRAGLVAAVNDSAGDVVLDVRGVSSFDDDMLVALTEARSRAKYLHHRIVVVDRVGGAVLTSLRRTGLYFRFPVYPDVDAAAGALVADRAARARLSFGYLADAEAHRASQHDGTGEAETTGLQRAQGDLLRR